MPVLSRSNFTAHMRSLNMNATDVAQASLRRAALETRCLYEQEVSDEVLDITVSFSGTCSKRGFTALYDIVFVLCTETVKVLDYEVLSKTCGQCRFWSSRKTDEPEAYERFMSTHKDSCDVNHVGSSGSMEVSGALILFSRSLTKHKFRYINMVSDGDSKAYSAVKDVYGSTLLLTNWIVLGTFKRECLKH